MAVLVLCSASGAPGVTVTSLGLALTWPRDVLLVDCDRTPSQAVLAGYLRGLSAPDLGLPGILQAHREREPLADAIPRLRLSLPEPPDTGRQVLSRAAETGRHFLPGFVHLGSVELFGGVWRELGLALREAPYDVIVDAGRIGTRGLPVDLVDSASRVAVVVRSSLVSLAALRLYVGSLSEQVGEDRLGLVIVGPGRPYGAKEVVEQFGVPVLAEIAWDPAAASDLHEGNSLSPKWRRQRLPLSYGRAAARLTASEAALQALIGEPVA